ncbi:MAG: hypothetical protein IPK07_31365 [Deltaproteobacteria bacterium]|nr:hypothetical protein [Deltaproteobacteria bacterium]
MIRDPVCGANVDEKSRFRVARDEGMIFFCSDRCRTQFLSESRRAGAIGPTPPHDERTPSRSTWIESVPPSTATPVVRKAS